jgi:hypothetical protein
MSTMAIENSSSTNVYAHSTAQPTTASKKSVWTGRILGGLAVLFLGWDAVMKLLRVPMVVEGTAKIGYPDAVIVPLGVVLLACVVLYAIPRTAILGAVLLTGYLGGAISAHVRMGDPLFSHVLFPIYVAIFLWGSLYLRDARVRAMIGRRPAS